MTKQEEWLIDAMEAARASQRLGRRPSEDQAAFVEGLVSDAGGE